jgi:hypothetical protein
LESSYEGPVVRVPVSIVISSGIASTITASVTILGIVTAANGWSFAYLEVANSLQLIAWGITGFIASYHSIKGLAAKMHRMTTKSFEEQLRSDTLNRDAIMQEVLTAVEDAKLEILAAVEQNRIGQYVAMAEEAEPRLHSVPGE